MEDSEDKLRRNLVVVSVAIVAIHWLRIDLKTSNISLLGLAINVDATRLWPAVLAILLYCLFRFHFSSSRAHEFKRAKEDFHSYRNNLAGVAVERALLDRVYRRSLEAYKKAKPEVITESINGHTLIRNGPPMRHAMGSARFPKIGFSGWRNLYYQILWDDETSQHLDQRYPHSPDQTDSMTISRGQALLIHTRAIALSAFWSRYTLELYFPYFAACFAIDLCLHGMGIDLPNHWWHGKLIKY